MRFLTSFPIPLPRAFQAAAELVLNNLLRRALDDPLDIRRIAALVEEARAAGVLIDTPILSYQLGQIIKRLAEQFATRADDLRHRSTSKGSQPASPAASSSRCSKRSKSGWG